MNYFFITGSSKGLGKALAMEAIKQQAHVFGLSRQNDWSHDLFKFISLDLSDAAAVQAFHFQTLKDATSITLINNAGILGEIDQLGQVADEQIQTVLQVNLSSPAVLINKFLKAYASYPCHKIIINISSGAATSPYESWSTYCASKAGLEMFTKVLDKENHDKVYAFSIAPGVVDTDMQAQIRQTSPDKFIHIEKFLELKKTGALYAANAVAEKIIQVALHPEKQTQFFFRVVL